MRQPSGTAATGRAAPRRWRPSTRRRSTSGTPGSIVSHGADEVAPQAAVKVLLVKFNDYQCPSCRQSYFAYKDTITKYEAQYPGVFKFETRDYPLEPGVRHWRRAPECLRGGGGRPPGARA